MNMRKTAVAAASLATLVLSGCGGAASSADGGSNDSGSTGVTTTVAPEQVAAQARAYVDAVNGNDLNALVESFAEDGAILDVSRRIAGRDAIREWADDEVMGGTLKVLEVTPMADGQDLLVHWAPSGSDGWRAHYRFTFKGDKVSLADLQYA
jgi:hypothetical protein